MKRITYFLLIVSAIITLSSCMKGKWPPIIVDKEELTFGVDGGTQTVTVIKNYDGWALTEIFDKDNNKQYFPKSLSREVIDGEGIKAVVKGKILIVTVSPVSSSTECHQWTITLDCGDAYKSINVWQNNPM